MAAERSAGHQSTTRHGRQSRASACFVTCLVDLFRPSVGFAAVRLLEDAGCIVEVPAQTCCGQPAFNSGDTRRRARARLAGDRCVRGLRLHRRAVRLLRRHDREALSGDCSPAIPALSRRAPAFAAKTYELVSFLTDVLKVDAVDATFPRQVTYHDSCSGLRELGVQRAAAQAAAAASTGLELTRCPTATCAAASAARSP